MVNAFAVRHKCWQRQILKHLFYLESVQKVHFDIDNLYLLTNTPPFTPTTPCSTKLLLKGTSLLNLPKENLILS